jgi:AraC-like DNA-binding protein
MAEVINLTLFFEGCMAALMAIVQLLQSFRDRKHIWPFMFFSCVAFIVLRQFYYGAYRSPDLEFGNWPGQFVKFLLGPMLFISYRKLFYANFEVGIGHIPHFIPAIIAVFIEAAAMSLASTPEVSMNGMQVLFVRYDIEYYYNIFGVMLISAYLLYIPYKEGLISFGEKSPNDRLTRWSLFFLGFPGIVVMLLMFAIIAHKVMLARFIGCFSMLPFIAVFIATYQSPDAIKIFTSMIRKKIYERSIIRGIDVNMLKQRLDDLMYEDKIFCDDDLSLTRLAGLLSITPHQLSEFLNTHMGLNFNNYINRLRVNEAIGLMKCQAERSISSICYSVGFNSRSVFYKSFIEVTGMSPAKYKKNLEL